MYYFYVYISIGIIDILTKLSYMINYDKKKENIESVSSVLFTCP